MDGELFADLHFPAAGVDVSAAFCQQPNRPVTQDNLWARTARVGSNVRGYEGLNRCRGGSRPGLSRYLASPVVADWVIQQLDLIVWMGGAVVQTSQSGRIVTLVAVSQGNVYSVAAGGTAWVQATNNTGNSPPLNFTGIMQSAALNQKLWFADGVNWVYYDPSDNSVNTWAATAGSLPVDASNNTPRLICAWRGRLALSGLIEDPQNIFFPAVGDPTDFDYSPASTTPTQAFALSTGPTGVVGDVITGLIAYTDDMMVVGADHSIWMLRGDPLYGGQLDLVSDAIGMAWGQAWAKDPYGVIYFVANRMGIFSLIPGQQPVRISQAIESLLLDIDTGETTFRLVWSDRFQGLHVFATTTAAPASDTHFFWEQRTGAWWTDSYGDENFNPLTCVTFDGNLPEDRVPLIGSWDGYVRAIDQDATTDDLQPISSSVVIGPLLTQNLDMMLVKDLQAVLGEDSGDVTYAVYLGTSAEIALQGSPVATGTWRAGRNLTSPIRRSAHALYVKLTSTNPWVMEQIRARIATKGKVARRGH